MTTKTLPAPAAALELITVAPAALGVRDQAREDATPDEQLIASVRQHGIIQPPVVELDPETGGHVIVTGHRRVGAAIAAGLTVITCILRPTPLDGEAVTLEQQIVENERRKQLSAKDLAAGYQKLSLFGLRPEDIAAGLGEKPERIRAGLKIIGSKTAADLVDTEQTIDLEQAAAIAEFDDHPKLQQKLVETATSRPENFARDVEQAKSERAVAEKVASIKTTIEDAGAKFIETFSYGLHEWTKKGGMYGGPGAVITALADSDGAQLTPASHAGCPGHAAVIHRASLYYMDREGGIEALYVCTDWDANGHTKWKRPETDKTPEELARDAEWEERRATSERLQAERAAQRELTNANTRVRRAWIHSHLTTGRLRPASGHFDLLAAAVLAELYHEDRPAAEVVLELLDGNEHTRGVWNGTTSQDALVDLIEAGATPALRIALARAFAYFEDSSHFDGGAATGYWTALETLGYTLTDTDKENRADAATALAEWKGDRVGGTDDDADVDEGRES